MTNKSTNTFNIIRTKDFKSETTEGKKNIEKLADKHNIKIKNNMEIPSIELNVDGVE
ncbi:hypothetical protein KLO04_16760 [Clostridioides difficile]|nr:hypothetical protein [Clostridioides difficile]